MEAIANYEQGWKFSVQCGRHTVHVDLPAESGGNDEAPNPPQYFLASLASCVGVYVLSFCKNSSLNADGMQIKISAEKAQHPSRLENINMEIALPNAQVGKSKEALLSVARKCLVHNTIEQHPHMEIVLTTG